MNPRLRRLAYGSAATLILATACGRERDGSARDPSAMTPFDHAVAAAKAIQTNPARTDSILGAHGFTRARFDTLMYEIAADSALARTYTAAIQ